MRGRFRIPWGGTTDFISCLGDSDPAAHSLYSSVLLHASQPYARTLIKWITTGTLKDPYDEFLIKEDPRINKGQLVYDYSDEYWERRYTVSEE